jgi:hypothetical protein
LPPQHYSLMARPGTGLFCDGFIAAALPRPKRSFA